VIAVLPLVQTEPAETTVESAEHYNHRDEAPTASVTHRSPVRPEPDPVPWIQWRAGAINACLWVIVICFSALAIIRTVRQE
jgi:hypothetical protein